MQSYTKTPYDVNYIIELVGDKTLNQLLEMVSKDEIYLNMILTNTHKII